MSSGESPDTSKPARREQFHAPGLVRLEQGRARRRTARAQCLDRGALLAEERAAEPADEVREDLALVVVVGAEVQARARPQLAARAGKPAVVRVLAELLVLDADVVGPRQDLPVQALHVVALVERVDDRLPVRVDDRAQRRAQPHLLEVVRREERRERVEEVEQRFRVRVEVDEHEPAPGVDAHRREREVVGQARELLAVGNVDEPPVERVTPAVVAAPDPVARERAAVGDQPAAAMQARVVERVQRARLGPHDHDRLVADRVLDEVAGRGDLLLAARDLPDPGPQPRLLELGEAAGRVPLLRHEAVGPHEQGLEVGHVRIGL